jgi:hypothetical protein
MPRSSHATLLAKATNNAKPTNNDIPKSLYFMLCRLVPVTGRDQRRVRAILCTGLYWQHVDMWGEVFVRCDGAHRNDGLHWATRQLRSLGYVDRDAAVELLMEMVRLNGYLAKDGPDAVMRTIESGWATSDALL